MINRKRDWLALQIFVIVLLGLNISVHAQNPDRIDPTSGQAGDRITIEGDVTTGSCYLQSTTGQRYDLQGREMVDDQTLVFEIPAAPPGQYDVYCREGIDIVTNLVGVYQVLGAGSGIPGDLQPEQYFARVLTYDPPRSVAINRLGNETVANIRFENAANQAIALVARGSNDQAVRAYAQSVTSAHFGIRQTGNLRLNGTSGVSGQTFSGAPDVMIDILLLSAGSEAGGWTHYTTFFAIDPDIGANQIHDYQSITGRSAAASVEVRRGAVSLNLSRTEPAGYSNQVMQATGSSDWLKNSIAPDEGNYTARVTGHQSNTRYTLMGTFDDYYCPSEDPGCPSSPSPVATVLYGRMDNAELLNVRTGPGIEWGVVTQLMRYDPIAAVGRNEAGTWIRLHTDEPRWINARYSTLGDVSDLPVSRVEGPAPNINLEMNMDHTGEIRDEYGNTWEFWNRNEQTYGLSVSTPFPTMVYVVFGGEVQALYFDPNTTYREFSIAARDDYPYSLLVRMDEGALGWYTLQLTPLG